MRKEERRRIARYVRRSQYRNLWRKIVRAMACVVVFCTTYALILPAITIEQQYYCGKEAHSHTEECGILHSSTSFVCSPGQVAHSHKGLCFTPEGELICPMEEMAEHIHTDGCYSEFGHMHDDRCYNNDGIQICGLEESQIERMLTCTLGDTPPHQHSAECLRTETWLELTCTLEEHVHDESCRPDPNADLETAADWEATLMTHGDLTGNWSLDLAAVSATQIGYSESIRNYDTDTRRGYSRYGGWYGVPYGQWDAMFVSFCLEYAGIPEEAFPRESDSGHWLEALQKDTVPEDWMQEMPIPGSILFYGTQEGEVRSAIVTGVETLPDVQNLGAFKTFLEIIEGDREDQVVQRRISMDEIQFFGACNMASVQNSWIAEQLEPTEETAPQEKETEPSPETTEAAETTPADTVAATEPAEVTEPVQTLPEETVQETEAAEPSVTQDTVIQQVETENYVVTVTYSPELVLPEGAELRVVEYPKDSEIFRQRCKEAGYELDWLLNIGFFVGEEELDLSGAFAVVVTSKQGEALGQDVTHFAEEGNERIAGTSDDEGTVSFASDGFSDFGGGTAVLAAEGVEPRNSLNNMVDPRAVETFNFRTVSPRSLSPGVDYVIYRGSWGNNTFLGSDLSAMAASGNTTAPYSAGSSWSLSASALGTSMLADVTWRLESVNGQTYLVSQADGQRMTIGNGRLSLSADGTALTINTGDNSATIAGGSYFLRYNNGWTATSSGWWGGNPETVYFAQVTPVYSKYPPAVSTGKAEITRLKFYNFLGNGEDGGAALAGCVYEIVGDNGKTYTLTSGNNPTMSLPADIADGNYTITLKSVPKGYIKDLDPVRTFSIENGSFRGTDSIGSFIQHPEGDVETTKEAQVENYAERIYQVLLGVKSDMKLYAMDPIDVRFVVDQSNSMLFPSGLVDTGKKVTLRANGTNNINNMERLGLDKSKMYYIMADPTGTATVWAVWHNGTTWLCQDASYYSKADHGNVDGYESPNGEIAIFPEARSYSAQADWETQYEQQQGGGLNVRSNGAGLGYDLSGSSLARHMNQTANGGTYTYTIYTASNEYNRLHYLEDAMAQVVSELADANPENHVSITRFTKEVDESQCVVEEHLGENELQELLDNINGIHTSGGTRQDLALEHVAKYHPVENGINTYTVLITDGSPDAPEKDLPGIYNDITTHANTIKGQGSVMMTVGLGMGANTAGLDKLYEIASPIADDPNDRYYYALNDAAGLVSALKQLLFNSMSPTGTLEAMADVEDEISDSFYPVVWMDLSTQTDREILLTEPDKKWVILEENDWITKDGKLTTEEANDAAGQLLKREDGTYYIRWKDMLVSTANGWNGSFYVKAKEDFMGGNAIDTNKEAKVNVYGTVIPEDVPDYDPKEHGTVLSLETPTVNVHLLDMTRQSSEVTVYLGDLVNAEGNAPLDTLKGFFAETDILKLISGGDDVKNAVTADGVNLTDSTFTLEYAIGRALTEDEWTTLANGGTLELEYVYDDASSHGPVGKFTFQLEKTGIQGASPDYGVHEATAACRVHGADCGGTAAETYVLNVRYDAYRLGEEGRPEDNAHNAPMGPGLEVGTGEILDEGLGTVDKDNVHKVHVISGYIDVTKKFREGLTAETDEIFTFILHRVEDGADTSKDVTKTITIPAGQSTGSQTITFPNLPRGTYVVTEAPDAEEVYTLESLAVKTATNCYCPTIGEEEPTSATFVLGHDTQNRNVIDFISPDDAYTGYKYPVTGVYGGVEFTNREMVYEGEIPVQKVWDDGSGNHTQDAVYLALYLNDMPVLDENGNARLLRLDAANNWQGNFTVVLKDENDAVTNYAYSVREVTAVTDNSSYTTWHPAILENDGVTQLYYEQALEHYGLVGVSGYGYIVEYTAGENGAWTVTNLKSFDLPETGSVGTHLYTFSGLLVMMAGLMYGYSQRRKKERGAKE